MTKDYISLEAAIKEMSHMMHECFPEAVEELDAVITTLKEIPASDVVEVVRCGECYFRALDGADVSVCTGAMAYSHTPDDWFCAAGKRKSNVGGNKNDK